MFFFIFCVIIYYMNVFYILVLLYLCILNVIKMDIWIKNIIIKYYFFFVVDFFEREYNLVW